MSGMVRNLTWLSAANFAVKPIWFVFITYVCIQILGVGGYGQMTAVLALVGICDGSLMLGSSTVTVREVARNPRLASDFLTNFLPARLVLSALALLVAFAVAFLSGSSLDAATILAAGGYVAARNLTEYGRALIQGLQRFKLDAASTVAEKLLVVAFGSLFLWQSGSVVGVLAGMSVGMLLTLLLTLWWARQQDVHWQPERRSLAFLKQHFRTAVPLGLSSIFVLLLYRTDSVMLESMAGEIPTGQYAIAFRITEAALLLPALLTTVLLPRLSEIGLQDRHTFWRTAGKGMAGLLLISVGVATVVMMLSGPIIQVLDDSETAVPSAHILQWLIWTFPLSSLNFLFVTAFTAADALKRIAWILGPAALLNIGLNLWLIPEYAAWGATFATLTTQAAILLAFIGSQLVRKV